MKRNALSTFSVATCFAMLPTSLGCQARTTEPGSNQNEHRVDAQPSQIENSGSAVRVGTFDSRALALAYYRSEAFTRQLNELRAEFEAAKEAGDEKRVKELEALGPAQQALMHKQGFGTWPVDNILEELEGKIPRIAKQANVDLIVSKWKIAYERPGMEFVDVTDLMVKPFNPDEKTIKTIKELRRQTPVPLKELENHQD